MCTVPKVQRKSGATGRKQAGRRRQGSAWRQHRWADPPRGNRPSLEVAIRLEGQGETGLVAVRFAPEGLPEDQTRMLDYILEGISFCP